MRKLALTSALTLALGAVPAFAHEGHQHAKAEEGLNIGGFINAEAGFASEDLDAGTHGTKFLNDTEVHVKYRKSSELGFAYGLVIELEADVTEDARHQGLNADKTYLYAESGWGRVELGANNDAGTLLGVDASTLARGTGGIHGDWDLHVVAPSLNPAVHSHNFIDSPSLPLHAAHGDAEDATKITYLSPSFGGLRFGGSFIPDSGDVGQQFSGRSGHHDSENVLNGGIQFQNTIGDVNYIVSAIGETGSEEVPGHEDLRAYQFGFNATYEGFIVGGSYGNWGESTLHANNNPDGTVWSLGAGYSHGAYGVSLTYLNSDYQNNELNNIVLGADYALAPGLLPYIEISRFNFNHSNPAIADNDGTVVLTGAMLSF